MIRLIITAVLSVALSPTLPAQSVEADVVVAASIVETQNGEHQLQIRADIRDGLHIYAQSQPKPFLATQLAVSEITAGAVAGSEFIANQQPMLHRHPQLGSELHEFEGTVVWTAPVQIEDGVDSVTIRGTLFAQACEDGRCYQPQTYSFEASSNGPFATTDESVNASLIIPTAVLAETPPPLVVETTTAVEKSPTEQHDQQFSLDRLEVEPASNAQSAWIVLPLSFLAGFLLNFMPCVLPVVGLKLLSFVQQADSDRRRILLMNLSYTAGLLSVMLVLASLAVFAGLGWGEQFSSTGFTVTLIGIVFAFGLSFLGVWDIPLPGFVSAADGKAPTEGYAGAFSKGILSTLLATPCSGPFLGAALAWAVTQPSVLTYAVFVTVGLGMASPYLLIGAFPSLIRLLPKPGNWMVTFKYVMGFVMLGTVIYLLSFVPVASVVPTAMLLLGIGIAVWYAGRTAMTAATGEKLRTWGIAVGILLMTTSFSFGWLANVMQGRFERAAQRYAATHLNVDSSTAVASDKQLSWQEYSPERLEIAIAAGQPVFVDFTADWCLTCKANEATAVNTEEFSKVLRKNNFVVLRADKTEPNPKADALLRKLGNSAASIPFYAVFHPETPSQPIVLDGIFTSPQPLVDAVQQSAPIEAKQVARR